MSASRNEHAQPRPRAALNFRSTRLRVARFVLLPLLLLACASSATPCRAQTDAAAAKPNEKADEKASRKTDDDAAPGQSAEAMRAAQRAGVTGSIKGRVLGEGGEPLSGVTVRANGRSSGLPFVPPATTATDEEGQFTLERLAPNVYNVTAELPGYVAESEGQPAPPRQRLGDHVTLKMAKGGVITGTVTDASGEPLVGANVRVIRVRDAEGRNIGGGFGARETTTDDRGVYRAYGLASGIYIVSAGGAPMWAFWPVPRAEHAPTYYPSGTRDTAAELLVRSGQETTGIDIRFREERGQRVSGTFITPPSSPNDDFGGVSVQLVHAASGTYLGSAWIQNRGDADRVFSFEGLADGDYDLVAQHSTRSGASSKSQPLRVSVRGADVTGIKLTLVALGSLSGTLSVEPLSEAERARGECKDRPAARLLPQETAIFARLDAPPVARGQAPVRFFGSETVPDDGGSFTARNLDAGRYRVEARPVDENFYTRAVQFPEAAPAAAAPKPGAARSAAPPSTSARDSIDLRPGQQLTGVRVRVAEGAAVFSGHLVPAEEGAQLPPQMRLFLVPSEREHADNLLRYASATPASDGAFVFRNLAPGRYLVLARQVNIDPADPASMRPFFWDANERAKMRREAEAVNLPIEFQPCQRIGDFTVRYPHAAK
ncbi:MAG TPA: carboxypeptidase-like regulatory domain-containing protein [Pyrinomonadaceae bacterium]|nr:carboxypeptidase-like regulatory domain-containing protein [Pyrinomonadaceae bacterium]